MSTADTLSRRTYSFVSNAPVIGAAVGGVVVTLAVTHVSYWKINVAGIFSGVFDITTILMGFLATFYIFVVARQNKFLESIQNTQVYRDAVGLLRYNIYWAGTVVIISWFCVVMNPTEVVRWSWHQITIFVWAFNTLLLAINFVRCVSHFNTIISAREK